jgi:integrase
MGRELCAAALVFPDSPTDTDKPIPPRFVTQQFGRVATKLGFAGLRFHDLRHNCASHLLNAGRPVSDVARQLGHATPAVTMAVYADAIPEKNDAAGLFDGLLPDMGSDATRT